MDEINIRSTSSMSADVEDFVLRDSNVSQLVFRPAIVRNPNDGNASVNGSFVWRRKGPKESWIDIDSLSLATLKKGQGYNLKLHASEVLELFRRLDDLYRIHASEGVPAGDAVFIRATAELKALSELSDESLSTFLEANKVAGLTLIQRLLTWASTARSLPELVTDLERLGVDAISKLRSAFDLRALESSVELWTANKNNASEQFWQNQLTERSYLFQQLYRWPCVVIEGALYTGGKNVFNEGGGLADYLVKNSLTNSVAIVEIKTPQTPLVASAYRSKVPNVSQDFTGAVTQVLTYKQRLLPESDRRSFNPDVFEAFDPHCVVIMGSTESLRDQDELRSFDLFRRQLQGVEIVTFDELFARVVQTIAFLRGETPESDVNELPW